MARKSNSAQFLIVDSPVREGLEKVRMTFELEISKEDLEKIGDTFGELAEVKRLVSRSLDGLNYRTQLLDPDWQGWRLKSSNVNS